MDISGLFPYQLRIDAQFSRRSAWKAALTRFLDAFWLWIGGIPHLSAANAMSHYLFAYERAPKTGKSHLQGIVWFPHRLSPYRLSQYRNYIKTWKHVSKTKQPVSFTKSIKPSSLMSYVLKDVKLFEGKHEYKYCTENCSTSLTRAQLALIPTWLTKSQYKKKMKLKPKEIFLASCKKYLNSFSTLPEYFQEKIHNPDWSEISQFCAKFSQIYLEQYNSPIRRNTLIYVCLKLNLISHGLYTSSLLSSIMYLQPN